MFEDFSNFVAFGTTLENLFMNIFCLLIGDEYVLTNDTSLHLRRPTTSESADIKQSFTMQNNNENKSAGCTTAMFVYFCNSFHINATTYNKMRSFLFTNYRYLIEWKFE